MVDPTSDVGAVDEETAPECAVCGEKIVQDPNHRVITWVDDDTVEQRHFCSEECKSAWDYPD